jgi:hypothetical protein
MKKLLYIFVGIIITVPTYAAPNDTHARVSMQSRAMVGTAQNARKSSLKFDTVRPVGTDAPATTIESEPEPEPNNRDAERTACMSNNIGVGNTFVWASKYSNTNDYASLIEDVDNPDNNVCFVRVEMRSNDSKINLSYIPARYFQMGDRITCGAWADKSTLEKNILDAKKTARTWATVGGAVGGAGIGVGAMELFGNKLIGGAVQGQKSLEADELFVSQLKELKKSGDSRYSTVVDMLTKLKDVCDKNSQPNCNKIDYKYILDELSK